MPTLRQLDYLVTLADTLHFRRAAERANTTQSTLSLQLKALEERLGAQLVERNTARVVLTPVGQDVVSIARSMLQDAQKIRDLTKSARSTFSGLMRLGVAPSVGPSLLPRVIPALRETFRDLKLYVSEVPPQNLIEQLEKGQHDAIITAAPVTRRGIASTPLFREPIYVALPCDHGLAQKDVIAIEDLQSADLLALEPGHPLHELVQKVCQKSGARLLQDYEGTSLDMLYGMVATGLGFTLLPGLYVRTRLANSCNVVCKTIAEEPLSRTIVLAWRDASGGGRAYAQFGHVIRGEISKTLPDFAV